VPPVLEDEDDDGVFGVAVVPVVPVPPVLDEELEVFGAVVLVLVVVGVVEPDVEEPDFVVVAFFFVVDEPDLLPSVLSSSSPAELESAEFEELVGGAGASQATLRNPIATTARTPNSAVVFVMCSPVPSTGESAGTMPDSAITDIGGIARIENVRLGDLTDH
jgi:hypothetical protein